MTAHAARHPLRPALVHNGITVGYGRLAEDLAAVRRRLGERPGTVAVEAVHAPATIAGLLGVWAAGGTYCPIDPAFPAARRAAMIEAARASRDDDLAYVLFTSGSTGAPKPVGTPRAAIGTVVPALCELFGLTADDRVLQFASLNWDTCFEEILPTLLTGAAVVLADDAHSGSFPRFLRAVERDGVTVLDLPTAFWHELVRHLAAAGTGLPPCVRLVVIGGEAVAPARLAEWRALQAVGTGRVRLLNTYGCTETTLITHAIDLDGEEAAPIGHPLPHVRERIGPGGELWIAGPALARGYLGRPDETAGRFVELDGERWFRTGDRVTRRADGALLHEGRLDRQVKIRGIRVDPGEVEARIAEHPGVRAVAVVPSTLGGHTVLTAYVVLSADLAAGTDLEAFLRERVPAHLVPARIAVVPELAYTASGKVDRLATASAHRAEEALR
ncbi:amino acid adenylation domain-containing protein [Dactylosporangium sp. NPDC048998]|uniref:amino acid adenylation domain-containing protein n=1 Tax=Dactylosporangium sp. NPDC048998 TaxID=3363976 RepID=UPI0037246BEA